MSDAPAPPRPVEPFRELVTPPSGTPAPLSQQEVAALLARNLRELLEHLPPLLPPDGPSRETPVPPSRRQVAAQLTGRAVQWILIANGVLGLAATVAHQFRPELEGPIQFLIKLLASLGGGQ